jgi:hypothetical protein
MSIEYNFSLLSNFFVVIYSFCILFILLVKVFFLFMFNIYLEDEGEGEYDKLN